MLTVLTAAASMMITASDPTELGSLCARAIEAQEEIEQITARMGAATTPMPDEKNVLDRALAAFRDEPLQGEELSNLQTQLDDAREQLAMMREQFPDLSNSYAENSIRRLEYEIQIRTMPEGPEREALRAEIQQERDALAAKIDEIEKPYQAEKAAIVASVDSDSEALTEAMTPFFDSPRGEFENAETDTTMFTMHMAFGGTSWDNAQGEQLAWAHVRIRSDDEISAHTNDRKLDGKYPIHSTSERSVWLWSGNFLVTFVASDESLYGEERMLEAVGQFVDLEGLAQVEIPDREEFATVDTDAQD